MAAITNFVSELNLVQVLEFLRNLIAEKENVEIATFIDSESTNSQVAGAAAVYEFVTEIWGSITQISYEVVTTLPTTGVSGRIYLILIQEDPEMYQLNMYVDGDWRTVGEATLDLSNYWSKDELVEMTDAQVTSMLDGIFT